jgi:hypothetical protein
MYRRHAPTFTSQGPLSLGASGKDTPISDMRPITVTSSLGRLVERAVWDTLFPEVYNDVICYEPTHFFTFRRWHWHDPLPDLISILVRLCVFVINIVSCL